MSPSGDVLKTTFLMERQPKKAEITNFKAGTDMDPEKRELSLGMWKEKSTDTTEISIISTNFTVMVTNDLLRNSN